MASSLVDLVKINITNSGTGALTLGVPAEGYRGTGVLTNGVSYGYSIQQDSAWEYGRGTYLSSSSQLVRSPIDSSNGGNPINVRAGNEVAFVALAEDLELALGGLAASQEYVDDAVAIIQASRGNWINVVDHGAAGTGGVYDTQLASAISLAQTRGVGVLFPNGVYTFNAQHDFGTVPFAGESETGTIIRTTLNGSLFKITVNATVEDSHYNNLTFYCDITTGGSYSSSVAIEIAGDATGFFQFGSVRNVTTYGFHTGIKVTKATRTTAFGQESDFDWFSLAGLTFNAGSNVGKYGVRFTAGSGTGTIIDDIRGSVGTGDAGSAYLRYEGACVVGDIVVGGHFGGATAVVSVAAEVASYLSNISIKGQIDGNTTTPVAIANSAVPLRYLNLTGCNLGGNVAVAGGIAAFVTNSVIYDVETNQWLAGINKAYTAGVQTIPLFAVDLNEFTGTHIDLVIPCLIGSVGITSFRQSFFIQRDTDVPTISLDGAAWQDTANNGYSLPSIVVTTSIAGVRVSFVAEFTAPDDGVIEAQLVARGGSNRVYRLTTTTPPTGRVRMQPRLPGPINPYDYPFNCRGDGTTDDSIGLQAAIDACLASNVTRRIVHPGELVFKTTAAINIPNGLLWEGEGVEAYQGDLSAGSVRQKGSWLYPAHRGKALNIGHATDPISGVEIYGLGFDRDQPTIGSGWTPNADDYDIYLRSVSAKLANLTFKKSAKWVKGDQGNYGRLWARDIQGQAFVNCFLFDEQYDIGELDQIEQWSYWADNANVIAYQEANLDAFYFLRVDNPEVGRLFSIHHRSAVRLGQSATSGGFPGGSTSKLSIQRLDGDIGKYAVWVDNTVTAATHVFINKLTAQGDGITGSNGIMLEGSNALVEYDTGHFGKMDENAIRNTGSGTGNRVYGTKTFVAEYNMAATGFAAFEASTGNTIDLGPQREIATGHGGPTSSGSGTVTLR